MITVREIGISINKNIDSKLDVDLPFISFKRKGITFSVEQDSYNSNLILLIAIIGKTSTSRAEMLFNIYDLLLKNNENNAQYGHCSLSPATDNFIVHTSFYTKKMYQNLDIIINTFLQQAKTFSDVVKAPA